MRSQMGQPARKSSRPIPPAIDFGPLPDYPGYQLRRAQARVFQAFESRMGDLAITPGSFGVLVLIDANPGITPAQVASAFGIDRSTLTPALQRLERRGLVRRRPLERDRRHASLYICEEKRSFIDEAFARLHDFERSVATRLEPDEERELTRLLQKLQRDQSGEAAQNH